MSQGNHDSVSESDPRVAAAPLFLLHRKVVLSSDSNQEIILPMLTIQQITATRKSNQIKDRKAKSHTEKKTIPG
jgi:hypothetical protein